MNLNPARNVSEGLTSCTSASDHMKNLEWGTKNGVWKMTGNLDENVQKMSVNVAAQVHVGWIPVPINVAVPISLMPGFVKGPVSLTLGPSTTSRTLLADSPDVGVDVTGNIRINDGNNEEIACLKLGSSSNVTSLTSRDETALVRENDAIHMLCCFYDGCARNCKSTGFCATSKTDCTKCGGNWCKPAHPPGASNLSIIV